MKRFWRNKGFTLLEIMIALSILAGSFLALLSAQGSSTLASGRAETLTTATLLARQKITEVKMEIEKDLAKNKFPQDDQEERGNFEEPFDDFRWKVTVKKVEIPLQEEGSEEGTNAVMLSYIKSVTEQISQKVREIKVTILWGDKDLPEEEQPGFTVTTHIVQL